MPIDANEALERLRAGNERFVTGAPTATADPARRAQLLAGQEPFAVMVGCSDSRVPPEIVFDQGLGDLFVVRVAGTIVTPTQLGSIEFAVSRFGTQLVVVLGHSGCGAVEATLAYLQEPAELTPGLASIVERIRPVVEAHAGDLAKAVRANVRATVEELRASLDGPTIIGAEYALGSGAVEFL